MKSYLARKWLANNSDIVGSTKKFACLVACAGRTRGRRWRPSGVAVQWIGDWSGEMLRRKSGVKTPDTGATKSGYPNKWDDSPDLETWRATVGHHLSHGEDSRAHRHSACLLSSDIGPILFPAWDRVMLSAIEAQGCWEPNESRGCKTTSEKEWSPSTSELMWAIT